MGRKRKVRNGKPADITVSTPGQTTTKKQRQDDESSYQKTVLSKNRYSTGGTAVNDSDLDGFGDEPEQEPQPQQQRAPVVKIPPLMVKAVGLSKLKATMKAINIEAKYKLCRVGVKVVLASKEDYQKAKSYLTRSKTEFYSFDMPSEKPFKAVIRGLEAMDTDDIKMELEHHYKLKPLAVFPMSRHDKKTTYRDCLYLVHFVKGSATLGALKAVRFLNDTIVEWEGYRGANRDVTQCMRCLHFGHGARNCNVKPRCGVCTQQHETKDCPIEEVVDYKCANCGGNHRATDRSCAKREEYKQIRKQAASRNQPNRRPRNAPNIDMESFPRFSHQTGGQPTEQQAGTRAPPPGLSYRDRLRQQVPPTQQQRPQQGNPLPQVDSTPLLTPEQLLPIFQEMWQQLHQCRTRADQILCLGEFIIRHG